MMNDTPLQNTFLDVFDNQTGDINQNIPIETLYKLAQFAPYRSFSTNFSHHNILLHKIKDFDNNDMEQPNSNQHPQQRPNDNNIQDLIQPSSLNLHRHVSASTIATDISLSLLSSDRSAVVASKTKAQRDKLLLSGTTKTEETLSSSSLNEGSEVSSKIPTRFSNLDVVLHTREHLEEEHELGYDYKVHTHDIICGRSNVACNTSRNSKKSGHPGNRRLMVLIEMYSMKYKDSNTKLEKSKLIRHIVDIIRQSNNNFVQRNDDNGIWYDIGNIRARDKIRLLFRDVCNYINKNNSSQNIKTSSTLKIAKEKRRMIHNINTTAKQQHNEDKSSVSSNESDVTK